MLDRSAHPREPRVIARCRIEFERLDRTVVAESEDLSRHGVFVRTDELLPVGAELALDLTMPDGQLFHLVARVAHLLSPSAARALGRHVGMGLAFIAASADSGASFTTYLDDLIDELTPPPTPLLDRLRLAVVAASAPLRARLANALAPAGFAIETFADGAAARAACSERPPDGVVLASPLAGPDGLALVRTLAMAPRLARVPVVVVSDDPSDLTRLEAFRLGVRDYVTRPFLDEELVIRVRRATERAARAADDGVAMLRGDLAEISLATLLSLFEFERKSGILVVSGDAAPARGRSRAAAPRAARLFVSRGRIVKVDTGSRERPARDRLMDVLDWTCGRFEFSGFDVVGADELGLPTTQLLLEHARVRDEAARPAVHGVSSTG